MENLCFFYEFLVTKFSFFWWVYHKMVFFCGFRFLRMRDFDVTKSREMFLNYLMWRQDFGVDAITKVNSRLLSYLILGSWNYFNTVGININNYCEVVFRIHIWSPKVSNGVKKIAWNMIITDVCQ